MTAWGELVSQVTEKTEFLRTAMGLVFLICWTGVGLFVFPYFELDAEEKRVIEVIPKHPLHPNGVSSLPHLQANSTQFQLQGRLLDEVVAIANRSGSLSLQELQALAQMLGHNFWLKNRTLEEEATESQHKWKHGTLAALHYVVSVISTIGYGSLHSLSPAPTLSGAAVLRKHRMPHHGGTSVHNLLRPSRHPRLFPLSWRYRKTDSRLCSATLYSHQRSARHHSSQTLC